MPHRKNLPKPDRGISPSELSLIADDLAGACDTGIEFLESLEQVTVVVDSDAHDAATVRTDGLVVWNTESRDLSPETAYTKIRQASRMAFGFASGKHEKRILVKKTDSAFRGNYGREITAVMDELEVKTCCLAPAIPEFGRVTKNGIQYLDGRPISESFYRMDPKHPVTESEVAKIAAIGNERRIGVLTLDELRGENNKKHVQRLLGSGVEVVVADGEFQEDLNRVVGLFVSRPERMVFVGGQALGHAVARHCLRGSVKGQWTKIPEGPILIACGTLHPKSREQINTLSRACGLDPMVILPGTEDDPDNFKVLNEKNKSILLNNIEKIGIGLVISPSRAAPDPSRVESSIAAIIRDIIAKTRLSGLLLTGGTTAYTVCQRIGVKQVQLRERIASGTIIGQVAEFEGMAICCKGGSLGEPDALIRFVDKVKSLKTR
jgi:uncharacterized protein YgbK (DUF1537 family)